MSMFDGLARIAKLRARRRTELLLDSLPLEVQKDIGWRWSPNRRSPSPRKLADWNF
jgi:hypothetical protein